MRTWARIRSILLFLILSSALLVSSALPAAAQSGRRVNVLRRDADITILQNGDARFVETWVVDFRNGAFTFAFREIPRVRLREIADWRVGEGDAAYSPNGGEHSFSVTSTLESFEAQTLDALLRGGQMRRLSDVRGSFYYNLDSLKSALYDAVVQAGFFPSSPLATRDGHFAFAKWAAVITVGVGFCASVATLAIAPLLFLPILALVLVEIALMGLSRIMPQRTPQGSTAAAKWNAFKRYLPHIEKYTNVADARDQFEKYLPYGIAFGLDKSWIEKFSRADTPAPAWYIPYASGASTPIFGGQSENGHRFTNDSSRITTSAPSSLFPPSPNGRGDGGEGDQPRSQAKSAPVATQGSPAPTFSAPTLNRISGNAFAALNTVNSNLFDFLNTSASAFTERPPTRSGAESFLDGVGEVLSWFGSSGSSSGSSSSDSSWSSSSSSSSSSGWTGGGSSGGRGSGGGSSGFG